MGTCTEILASAPRSRAESQVRSQGMWFWPALSCAIVLLAILLANPFNEAGFDDDWSYGRVAMRLAQTGKLRYNGWGSPLVLFQSIWAVPWIRTFGFSFQVLQVATIPISLGFVLLVYATGRQAGLSKELAAFASIGAGTSPLFLPFAASFMTEAYGCFFSMACIYCALRAVQAKRTGIAVGWLWTLAIAGLMGGANRQIVWAAPIALIPYVAWERRIEPAFRTRAGAAFGALGLAIAITLRCFSQPYGPMQLSRNAIAWLVLHRSADAVALMLRYSFVAMLMAVPAFACFLPLIRWRPVARSVVCLSGLVLFTGLGVLYGWPIAPYGNNIFSVNGISVGQQDAVGVAVAILPPWLRILFTGIVNACVIATAAWGFRILRKPRLRADAALLRILSVFALSYLPLIFPGALIECAFDRYMLPLVPVAFLATAMELARRRTRVPVVGWCCLIVFAGYGIATTHDYTAGLRARTAAAHQLEKAGVGRERISAGFEYDGWTALEKAGRVRGSQYTDLVEDDSAKGFWIEFWDHAPELEPDYVILNRNSPEPLRGGEAPTEYLAWLPPFRRSVVTWKRSDLTAELQAARIVSAFRIWR